MGKSIGLLELKSIPVGVETADVVLKAANVELLSATATCPGKYVILLCGAVGAVKNAMESGILTAGVYLVAHHIINNVHDSVPGAIMGTTEVTKTAAIGMIETMTALTAVMAGDLAAKAANVTLMEIRIARGLGGKGYILLTGEVSAVRSAVKAAMHELEESGDVTSSCVIPSPHRDLIDKIYNM
jgi:microcompartment protein CcmL/EutN